MLGYNAMLCQAHTRLILGSYQAHAKLILCSCYAHARLMLWPYQANAKLILCSCYDHHTRLILGSCLAHAKLILRSYLAHAMLGSGQAYYTTQLYWTLPSLSRLEEDCYIYKHLQASSLFYLFLVRYLTYRKKRKQIMFTTKCYCFNLLLRLVTE